MSKFNIVISILLICSLAQAKGDWPDFRGPAGNGHVLSAETGQVPIEWSETKNVKWKTAIPHKGWSSPVVFGKRVWLTTATEDGHDFFVLCVNAETGEILVNKKVFHSDNPEALGNNLNCYAAPSPVVEDGRVYVHFGSYGTACLNAETFEVIWQRSDLECRHFRGPGSSPILFENLLILTMDGVDVQYLVALDKTTGKNVWKTPRTVDFKDLGPDGKPLLEGDQRKAFSTPLLIEFKEKLQMLTLGAKAVYAYNPKTGLELWQVRHPSYSGAARPVYGNGIVYFAIGFDPVGFIAVRVDGKGDVSDSHVLWQTKRSVPRMPSPILTGELLFWVTDNGIANCVDAKTGARIWKHRLGGNYCSSPILVGEHLYFFDRDGKGIVLKAASELHTVAVNRLDEGLMASPAVTGNALIVRTKTHLYRIQAE